MFMGTHMLIYSSDPAADRAFLRDVLKLDFADAGEGWLIFGLPPAEVGVHPLGGEQEGEAAQAEGGARPWGDTLMASMFFMAADISAAVAELRAKGVDCGEPQDEGWGISSWFALPSGGRLGMYQPRHPLAIKA
ncbi:extradiol dioxygenase [bacterium]|nr:extradiol dioxygenase [bacterium]